MVDINYAKKKFLNYVSTFDNKNPMIQLKINHTLRVCENSINICKSLNLDETDTFVAYIIALLHDIGRFKQIEQYHTFSDTKSIDHADYGIKLLFDDGLIRSFLKDDKYDEIIKQAIKNHNKYMIECVDEKELLHSKIVRDADILDIFYDTVVTNEIPLFDDDSKISDEVECAFSHNNIINHKNKKTQNDRVITKLALLFGLSFDYSYEYVKEKNFINLFYSKLKNKFIFDKYVELMREFIERKNKCVEKNKKMSLV